MPTANERIKEYNKNRIPQFLQLKYLLMQQNAFRFYRGTCHLFYEDLAKNNPLKDPTKAWLCGDMHLENFGSYKGADQMVHFDINDFDETALGPITWDISRFIISVHLAADLLNIPYADQAEINKQFVKAYCDVITKGKALTVEKETTNGIVKEFLKNLEGRKREQFIAERTYKYKDTLKLIINNEKTFPVSEKQHDEITQLILSWQKKTELTKRYEIADIARRVAGTGSVGLIRYIILVKEDKSDKYYLLDMKEAISSSLSPFTAVQQPHFSSEAERIITIQKRVQQNSPALLSTLSYNNYSFVIRRLQSSADKINLALFKNNSKEFQNCVLAMAEILASGHLRAAGWQGAISVGDLAGFVKEQSWFIPLFDYAKNYTQQVKHDYELFVAACKKDYFK